MLGIWKREFMALMTDIIEWIGRNTGNTITKCAFYDSEYGYGYGCGYASAVGDAIGCSEVHSYTDHSYTDVGGHGDGVGYGKGAPLCWGFGIGLMWRRRYDELGNLD